MAYDVGDRVRFSATFKDINGTAMDPTTITFKIKSPSGTTTTYVYGQNGELVRTGTGTYRVDFDMTEGGVWNYRWEGSGALVVAEEGQVTVKFSKVA